jgi:PAS domain S-box-containing protein
MWADRTSIQAKYLRNMIFITLVSIGLWCFIWVSGEYSAFQNESESLRAEYIESQKDLLKSEVAGVVQYVKFMRGQAEQKLKLTLKKRVYEAHQIASNIYQVNKGSKPPVEIAKMIRDALRPIRFNEGRGYIFAVSMEGVEQLYPVKAELEGKNLIDLRDSKGHLVIQDEIQIVRKSGEGFVKDYWAKPEKDTALLFPKISFVKHFEPLDWYFGTGEYLDDAKRQIQHEVLNRIASLRFGLEGYFFGSTFNGESLFSNGTVTLGAGNIWALTDPDGIKIIQEQRNAAQNPGGGFVSYSWRKLDQASPSPKISYVLGVPDWEWTIGAGVYVDTIEDTISKKREILEIGVRKKILTSVVVLVTLLILIYFWFRRISNQISTTIEAFSLSLKRANTDARTIEPGNLHFQEFKEIAHLTNKMLSARKKAEEALRESEGRFRAAFDSAQDCVLIWDREHNYLYANQAAIDHVGTTPDKVIGKNIREGLGHVPDFMHLWMRRVDKVFETGKRLRVQDEQEMQGRFYYTDSILSPIRDTENNVISVCVVYRDVTELKKAEEEKNRLESQLRQAARVEAVGTLAGGVAHDFNNILGIIIGNTELAMMDIPEWSPARNNLKAVKTASMRAKNVVQQLLSFSRKSEQEKQPLKLHAILKESVQLLRASIPSSIEFRSTIPARLGAIVADPTQIHQVLINLCTNAAHAMDEKGGTLELRLVEVELDEAAAAEYLRIGPGRYIQLTVSDTGSGIDAEIMDRIFDPYFSTKEVDKGSGLGLSVVHRIVENHNGSISIASEPDKGTTVTVLFPAIDEMSVKEEVTSDALPTGTETVLLVDDEEYLLDIGAQILGRLGYRVEVSANPLEALERYRSDPDHFDLIITDMTMPHMTGKELIKEILITRPDMRTILSTGFSEKIDRERASELGIKKYIEKPLNMRELAVAIREVLDGR